MIVAPCLERIKNRKDKTARDTCPRSTDEFATTTIHQCILHHLHHHEKEAQNLVSRVFSSSSSSASTSSKSPSPSNVLHASHHHNQAVPTNEEDRNSFPSSSDEETTPSHEHLIPFPRSPPHPVTTGWEHDEQHQEGQRPVDQPAASASSGSLVSCSNEKVGGDEGKGERQKPGQSGTLLLAAYPELSAFHPEAYPEQKRPNTAEHAEHHAIHPQKPAPAPPNNHAPRKRGRIPLFALAKLPPLPPPSPAAAAAVPSKTLVSTSAVLQSLSPTRLMPPAKNLEQIPRFVTTTYTMMGITESSSPAAASAAPRSVSSTPSPPASRTLKRRELPIPVAMVPIKQESDADDDDAGDSKTHGRTFSFSSTSSLYSTKTKKAKKTDTTAATRSTRNQTDRVSGTAAEGEDEATAVLRSRKSFDRLSRALVAGVAKGMSAFSRNGAGVGGGVEADSSRSGVMREPKEEEKETEMEMEMGDDDEEIGWAAFLQSDKMGHGDDERRLPATSPTDRTSLGRRSATTTTTGNQRSSSDAKQTQTIPRRKSRLLMMATTSSSTLGYAFSSRFGGGGAKRVEREDRSGINGNKEAGGWTPAAGMSPRRRKFSEASWGDSPMAMLGRDDSMTGEKSIRGTCDVGKGSPKIVGNAAATHLERSGTSPSSRYDHPLRLLRHGLAWGAMKRTTTSTSTSVQARIISRPYPFHHHQPIPSLCETSRLSDQSTITGTTASHPSSSMSMSYHERVATPTLSVGKKALLIAEDDQGGRETARLETLARLEGRISDDDVATEHEKTLDYKGGWVLGLAFAKQVGAV